MFLSNCLEVSVTGIWQSLVFKDFPGKSSIRFKSHFHLVITWEMISIRFYKSISSSLLPTFRIFLPWNILEKFCSIFLWSLISFSLHMMERHLPTYRASFVLEKFSSTQKEIRWNQKTDDLVWKSSTVMWQLLFLVAAKQVDWEKYCWPQLPIHLIFFFLSLQTIFSKTSAVRKPESLVLKGLGMDLLLH